MLWVTNIHAMGDSNIHAMGDSNIHAMGDLIGLYERVVEELYMIM